MMMQELEFAYIWDAKFLFVCLDLFSGIYYYNILSHWGVYWWSENLFYFSRLTSLFRLSSKPISCGVLYGLFWFLEFHRLYSCAFIYGSSHLDVCVIYNYIQKSRVWRKQKRRKPKASLLKEKTRREERKKNRRGWVGNCPRASKGIYALHAHVYIHIYIYKKRDSSPILFRRHNNALLLFCNTRRRRRRRSSREQQKRITHTHTRTDDPALVGRGVELSSETAAAAATPLRKKIYTYIYIYIYDEEWEKEKEAAHNKLSSRTVLP